MPTQCTSSGMPLGDRPKVSQGLHQRRWEVDSFVLPRPKHCRPAAANGLGHRGSCFCCRACTLVNPRTKRGGRTRETANGMGWKVQLLAGGSHTGRGEGGRQGRSWSWELEVAVEARSTVELQHTSTVPPACMEYMYAEQVEPVPGTWRIRHPPSASQPCRRRIVLYLYCTCDWAAASAVLCTLKHRDLELFRFPIACTWRNVLSAQCGH